MLPQPCDHERRKRARHLSTHQLRAGLMEYPVTADGKLFTFVNLLCEPGFSRRPAGSWPRPFLTSARMKLYGG